MRKLKEVLRLKLECGLKHRQIERAVGVSVGAVSKYCRLAKLAGLSWPVIERLDDTEIERLLQPVVQAGMVKRRRIEPDYAQVHRELKRKGVTLTLLWEEYRGRSTRAMDLRLHPIHPALPRVCRELETLDAPDPLGGGEIIHRLRRAHVPHLG